MALLAIGAACAIKATLASKAAVGACGIKGAVAAGACGAKGAVPAAVVHGTGFASFTHFLAATGKTMWWAIHHPIQAAKAHDAWMTANHIWLATHW